MKLSLPELVRQELQDPLGDGPVPPERRSFIAFSVYCARATQEFLTNNSMQMAASIAFYSFFSLFPLTLLIIIGYETFAGASSLQEAQLRRVIGTFVPVSQDVITETINAVARSRGTTGPLALAGLVWASTAVFATLRKGINTAWNIRTPRAFLKERVIDLTLTIGAGLLFIVLLFSTSALRSFEESHGLFGGATWQSVLSFFITFAAFCFIYRFLPNRRVRTQDVLFGAAVAAVAFEAAKAAFFFYSRERADLDQVYGALGSVAVLLGWLYVSAAIILVGALITAIHSRLVQIGMLTHLDVWSLGLLPLVRHSHRTLRASANAARGGLQRNGRAR